MPAAAGKRKELSVAIKKIGKEIKKNQINK